MDADWDLDSVLELCCSKLSPEAELPALGHEGHLDWLDEKVDLSAWVDLDFPDDLPPAAMTTGAGHHPPRITKSDDPWQSMEMAYFPSPEYLSPPDSPNTPVAIVPNVDIFLNLSPAPSVESCPADASSPSGLPPDPADTTDHGVPLVVAAESGCLSPPRSPASPSRGHHPASSLDSNETESSGSVESSPQTPEAAPSVSFRMDCRDDPTDQEFVPRESDSESEEEPKAGRPGPKRGRARKPARQRRKRKAADTGGRRERKRLQNKDAATRYRRKKRQEYDIIEEEFQKLSRINDGLKAEAARVGNEVSYLKGLMRELFRAKGLLP